MGAGWERRRKNEQDGKERGENGAQRAAEGEEESINPARVHARCAAGAAIGRRSGCGLHQVRRRRREPVERRRAWRQAADPARRQVRAHTLGISWLPSNSTASQLKATRNPTAPASR
eukprot:3783393-Pleurochrysis_carterae.AAC.3